MIRNPGACRKSYQAEQARQQLQHRDLDAPVLDRDAERNVDRLLAANATAFGVKAGPLASSATPSLTKNRYFSGEPDTPQHVDPRRHAERFGEIILQASDVG